MAMPSLISDNEHFINYWRDEEFWDAQVEAEKEAFERFMREPEPPVLPDLRSASAEDAIDAIRIHAKAMIAYYSELEVYRNAA
jgi:hypothetical protein